MDATPSVPTITSSDTAIIHDVQNGDHAQTTVPKLATQSSERVITPIQPPLQSGASAGQRLPGGYLAPGWLTPNFIALRTTTIQLALGYPLTYARALMQMGYEPLSPYRGKSLFGKEALYYPNIFRYLQYIYQTDGVLGLYRGFGCSLLSKVVCLYTSIKIDELLGPVDPQVPNDRVIPTWNTCIQKVLREVRCQSWGILLSHPFQVMAIRCMGQFIGRETIYSSSNIFQNIREIYERQGIGGFFVGLIPRWLIEIGTIVITNVVMHLLKSQIPADKGLTGLYDYIATFAAQTVTYPLSVVTTITAINRSGLRAGMLPLTPVYANWQDAYSSLSKTQQLKRGSSLLNRAVIGTTSLPTPGTPIPNA